MKIIRRCPNGAVNIPRWQLDPVLTRIFWSRGIKNPQELVYNINDILPPNFKGINNASEIIAGAVVGSKKIRVIGDYDADGATSTALAMRFFKDIGFSNIDYYIPKRQNDGYGLNEDIVDNAKQQGVELIITVDNGISAVDAVKKAKDYGMQVVITDHHLPAEKYPIADAIVNPHQEGCEFKSKNLAGVGVIFYVLACVRAALRRHGYFAARSCQEPIMSSYLDLVALGTVADIVPMDYNNRLMVSLGIGLIRKHNTSLGIEELIKVSGRRSINFTSTDICFSVSPRLNAAGRIDDMKYGVDCLLSNDSHDAKTGATLLHSFNLRRRDIETEMYSIARDQIKAEYGDIVRTGIVIYHPDFHSGVSGILAAKLLDELNVPVIVFADNKTTNILTGSGRSLGDYHLRNALERIGALGDMFKAFGGHKNAAGVSLYRDKLAEFKRLFSQDVDLFFNGVFPEKNYVTDGELADPYFSSSFARALVYDHPWGADFPSPDFDGVFFLIKQIVVKNDHLRLLMRLENGKEIWAMYFYYDKTVWPNNRVNKVRVVYCFDIKSNSDDGVFGLIIRAMEPV